MPNGVIISEGGRSEDDTSLWERLLCKKVTCIFGIALSFPSRDSN